jgi:hypothetical protein
MNDQVEKISVGKAGLKLNSHWRCRHQPKCFFTTNDFLLWISDQNKANFDAYSISKYLEMPMPKTSHPLILKSVKFKSNQNNKNLKLVGSKYLKNYTFKFLMMSYFYACQNNRGWF